MIAHGLPGGVLVGCRCARCRVAGARMHEALGSTLYGVPRFRAARRVEALYAIGYTPEQLAAVLGVKVLTIYLFRAPHPPREAFARLCAAYPVLARRPVDDRAGERVWPSPMCWDNIDDPNETPHRAPRRAERTPGYHSIVDHAAVTRIMNGENVPCSRATKVEVVARWLGAGRTWTELERITGWNLEKYRRPTVGEGVAS